MLDLAHAKVPFGSIVREGDVWVACEEQYGGLVLLEALPEIVSVGLGDSAALAVLPGGYGRKFLFTTGEDVAVAFLQVLVLARGDLFAFTLGDLGAGFLQQALHVLRPRVSVGLDDEGKLAQQMRATQAVVAVFVGKVGRPAIVYDDPSVARDDTDCLHRLLAAFLVQELQGDLAARADVDPLIFLIDPQRGLVHVQGGQREEPVDRRLLPLLEGQMQQHHVLEDGRLGDDLAEQGLEGLLHALQGEHLGDQQIERIRLNARPVLQGTTERLRERSSGLGAAMRAALDLGIDVRDDLFEDDVDLGAPFVPFTANLVQILTALLAEADLGDFIALDGTGIGRAGLAEHLALAVGARAGDGGLVLRGLRGGFAGVGAVLWGVALHEDRHQHLQEHQQGLDQGAAFGRDLAVGAQLGEAALQRAELLAQGLFVDARHRPRRLRLGLDGHQRREHRESLARWQRAIAPTPVLRLAPDALPVGVVLAGVVRPMHPIGREVKPQLLGPHAALVHHLELKALPTREALIVQRRGVAGENHVARQTFKQLEKLEVVPFLVIKAIAAARTARRVQIRRVAVDQLPALIVIVGQEPVRAAVHQLHRVGAAEPLQRTLIPIDPDITQRRRLALHDRPAAEVSLDIGVMRRHQRDNRLTQARGRLRSEIRSHRCRISIPSQMDQQRRRRNLHCQALAESSGRVRA